MTIEYVICPCCNNEFRVNVPAGREIEDVFIASHILSSLTRRHDRRMLCPKCFINVYVSFSKPSGQVRR